MTEDRLTQFELVQAFQKIAGKAPRDMSTRELELVSTIGMYFQDVALAEIENRSTANRVGDTVVTYLSDHVVENSLNSSNLDRYWRTRRCNQPT